MGLEGKSKRKSNRGGRRPGSGRPPERHGPRGISWSVVRQHARLGADRELIVRAMGLTPEQLRDPAVIERFQEELARGEAQHRIDLLKDVRRLRQGGPGKVNAVLASLKQVMGWNKPDTAKGVDDLRPDSDAAVAEIQRMLRRFDGPR